MRSDIVIVASHGDSLVTFRGDLIQQMRRRGKRVLAVAPALTDSARAWMTKEGVQFLDAPLSRTGRSIVDDLRFLAWLRQRIHEARPEAVLAYTVKPVVYGMLAALGTGARRYALITGLGYAFTDGAGDRRRLRFLLEQLYRLALRGAHEVFFQNPDDERFFREQRLLPSHVPSLVLPGSGINVERFAVSELPTGAVTFLLIARLLGDKGIREYVEAARRLRAEHAPVRVQLVGWIDENPDAIDQRELDAWVAEGSIEYLGKLSDVRPAIAACTVYVLPSYREGTPRTVLEAMAMGRPIVTTDAPGCRETVTDGDNGFLVPVRNADELYRRMKCFVVEPELASRMGRRSREIAESKYDVRRVSAVMLDRMGVVVS